MMSDCVMLLVLILGVHKNESMAETYSRSIIPNMSLNHVASQRRNVIPANETLSSYYLSYRHHW